MRKTPVQTQPFHEEKTFSMKSIDETLNEHSGIDLIESYFRERVLAHFEDRPAQNSTIPCWKSVSSSS